MVSFNMKWKTEPVEACILAEGYSFSGFDPEKDIEAWGNCIHPGLNDELDNQTAYRQEILGYPEIDPARDILFLDYRGEHVGTVTAFVWAKTGIGHIHMVGIRKDQRGKGLARFLCCIAKKTLAERGVPFVTLHTDTGRPGALKSYLNAGFLPIAPAGEEENIAREIMSLYGGESVRLLKEDGTPVSIKL